MMSFKVRFWAIKVVKNRRRPYGVRWVVENEEKSEWFITRALADSFRSDLMQAARRGEAFDTETGLPESKLKALTSGTWYEHARKFVAMRWKGSPGKTRSTIADCLAVATAALVKDQKGAPDPSILHRALAAWAFNVTRMKTRTPPDEIASALAWVEQKSVPLAMVGDSDRLRAATKALTCCLDGREAKPSTIRRRYSVLRSCLDYAVEREIFDRNPLEGLRWKRPEHTTVVDPRSVPNPAQVRMLLDAVPVAAPRVGEHLGTFFACLYFAGMRPSEVVNLRRADCELPAKGWGRLLLVGSSPAPGRAWTDSGELHEERTLKHRADGVTRPVPIPPELVVLLLRHIARFGVAEDGRLFRSGRGNRLAPASYEAVWKRARAKVLPAQQLDGPLASRPYDLRHACLSLWLSSGIDPAEVAERAGHSVEMLLRTYAHCIEGREAEVNRRIEAALGSPDAPSAEHAEQAIPTPRPPSVRVPRSFRDYRQTMGHRGARSHPARTSEDEGSADERPDAEITRTNPPDVFGRLHSRG
ncbi:tyrosine-type recombinase/integrase [Actinomadura oligospora]|uniref:tyrosine-type recombinase/integrase n=1 Tax=Actinomadura oligospora TaxID=111804 RepID=UPI0004ACF415|nr:tyrosine-type recombinase/integrase [Actinomadura oligospora]